MRRIANHATLANSSEFQQFLESTDPLPPPPTKADKALGAVLGLHKKIQVRRVSAACLPSCARAFGDTGVGGGGVVFYLEADWEVLGGLVCDSIFYVFFCFVLLLCLWVVFLNPVVHPALPAAPGRTWPACTTVRRSSLLRSAWRQGRSSRSLAAWSTAPRRWSGSGAT